MKYSMFVGKWQPFHEGHRWLIEERLKLKKGDTIGGKTKKYSEAGKGDKNRVSNISKYAENWEKIFGNKKSKKWNSL